VLVFSDAYGAVGVAIGRIYGVLKAWVERECTVAYVRQQVRRLALLICRLLGNKARAYGPPLLNNLIPLLAPMYVIAKLLDPKDYRENPEAADYAKNTQNSYLCTVHH